MKKRIMLFLFVVCGSVICSAQQALSTAGGEAGGTGGTVSYTLGQVVQNTFSGTSGTVMQGVQQPFEILVVTGIESDNKITLKYAVYPNPATDFLTLSIQQDIYENLSYQLIDMNGKILDAKVIEKMETGISLQGYLSTVYFLKVIYNEKEIKTFKIIKNNTP